MIRGELPRRIRGELRQSASPTVPASCEGAAYPLPETGMRPTPADAERHQRLLEALRRPEA